MRTALTVASETAHCLVVLNRLQSELRQRNGEGEADRTAPHLGGAPAFLASRTHVSHRDALNSVPRPILVREDDLAGQSQTFGSLGLCCI